MKDLGNLIVGSVHPCDAPGFRKFIVTGSQTPAQAMGLKGTRSTSHELFSFLGLKEAGA